MALLEVSNLDVRFDTREGVVKAVNGMDFEVREGETSVSGEALFRGKDLLQMKPRELNSIRGRHIAMIFQDPMTSLNPFLTIEKQMTEVVRHHQGLRKDEAREHAIEMLRAVRIPDPEERRVMIAMGLLCEPDLLIADEPSTALDVTVQAQITELVGEIRKETRMSLILITHDLAVVAEGADRIIVMYAGEAVETGSVDDIFYRPQHPYTRGLLASVPRLDRASDDELQAIPGNPPNLLDLPSGCHFRDRCSEATGQCSERPPLWVAEGGRSSRCFLPMEGGEIVAVGNVVEQAE